MEIFVVRVYNQNLIHANILLGYLSCKILITKSKRSLRNRHCSHFQSLPVASRICPFSKISLGNYQPYDSARSLSLTGRLLAARYLPTTFRISFSYLPRH